jgi:uncharacterized protein YjbJ (UPF0337 family)
MFQRVCAASVSRIAKAFRFGADPNLQVGDAVVDKDRIDGMAKQVKGSVKEAIGKVTGDTKTQAEGAADKAAGKGQKVVGGAKDAVRDAADE